MKRLGNKGYSDEVNDMETMTMTPKTQIKTTKTMITKRNTTSNTKTRTER